MALGLVGDVDSTDRTTRFMLDGLHDARVMEGVVAIMNVDSGK